jgi:hypothetical protein
VGATAGGVIGAIIDVGAAAAGVPLPAGTSAALGTAAMALISYFTRGGRKGEAD